jgi:Protein of unknown function (DUF3341)
MVATPERLEAVVEAPLYGAMAEFDTAEQLLRAAREAHAAGYRRVDAYAPFPIEGLAEALGSHTRAVPLIALTAGTIGAATGYLMQLWIHAAALPLNVGGRPLNSWPSFVPVTFELAVLFAGLAILASVLVLNGLPEPYHPVFNVEAFSRASRDRFFLCIAADDPKYDQLRTRRFLEDLGAREVSDVPD